MSHSQFHCTARVYLDMHGLSFETSICYWQDQPGSRHPSGAARRRGGGPPARRALPTPPAATRRGADAAATGGPPAEPPRPGGRGGAWAGKAPRARGPRQGSPRAPTARPRRPALPAPPRARSRDRCAASVRRPFRRLAFASPSRGHAARATGRGSAGADPPPGPARPALGRPRGTTGRARGDGDPTRRARPGDRGPLAGAARSAAGRRRDPRRSPALPGRVRGGGGLR